MKAHTSVATLALLASFQHEYPVRTTKSGPTDAIAGAIVGGTVRGRDRWFTFQLMTFMETTLR